MSWNLIKEHLSQLIGIEAASIHFHVGMLLFLLFCLVFRRSQHRWILAFSTVALLELGNEALDIAVSVGGLAAPNWRNGLVDLADTLLWPLALTLMAQAGLLNRRSRP